MASFLRLIEHMLFAGQNTPRKSTVSLYTSVPAVGILVLLLWAQTRTASATIIPAERMVPWVPGVTVGVRGAIPTRTNLIDVTRPPYNADKTGTRDASAAINSAISAANSNDVVYIPAGIYNVISGIRLKTSYITLRGAGTNTVLVGSINIGLDPSGADAFSITNGATKGSTSFNFATMTDRWGSSVAVGDMYAVCSKIDGSETFPYISIFSYTNMLRQVVIVTGISGNTLTFTPPLVWDFTNSPTAKNGNLNGVSTVAPRKGIGIESLFLTTTNGNLNCTPGFMLFMSLLSDCWVTNCSFYNAENYSAYLTYCAHVTFAHNNVRFAKSSGSNHSGLLVDNDSGCLIEDNIFADGLAPGIEFNTGFSGNVVFGNYFTNNVSNDIVCHNTHPVMNLFEANRLACAFEMDGYFGSASHQTLFRNSFASPYVPLAFKRWITYMNLVGNILGTPNSAYTNFSHDIQNLGWQILELGRPNIGNSSYTGTTPPIPWNFPGWEISDGVPNGICVFTNTQVNTTNLIGNFSNIPSANGGNGVIIFQDNHDINSYWPKDGVPVVQSAAGTSSKLFINHSITVSNGWRVFYSWQNPNCYQQLQSSNKYTHLITGNYDYFNHAVTWDTNGVQAIPDSLLYTNGRPLWWGTNSWPAIGPDLNPATGMIPAQERFLGIPSGVLQRPSSPSGLRVL